MTAIPVNNNVTLAMAFSQIDQLDKTFYVLATVDKKEGLDFAVFMDSLKETGGTDTTTLEVINFLPQIAPGGGSLIPPRPAFNILKQVRIGNTCLFEQYFAKINSLFEATPEFGNILWFFDAAALASVIGGQNTECVGAQLQRGVWIPSYVCERKPLNYAYTDMSRPGFNRPGMSY